MVLIEAREQVPPRAAEQVSQLLSDCFDRPRTAEQLATHRDRYSGGGDAIRHVLAWEGRTVVGFVRVFMRTITFDGDQVRLGGIGDVCTRPDWRGRGVARAALAAAMQVLHRAHADVAYLCADLGNPSRLRLYGQFDFVPLGRPHTYLGSSGTRYTDTDGMLAPVGSREVFERIMAAAEPFDIGRGNW